jgi:hypothetical protein
MWLPLSFVIMRRLRAAATVLIALAAVTRLAAQAPTVIPLTDKLTGLTGTWIRIPDRGEGGICGVSNSDKLTFAVTADAVEIGIGRFSGRVPLNPGAARSSDRPDIVAITDAGWLKLTMTTQRNGGFANVMQEEYILNRDRSLMTVWRTLNVRRPDGLPDKIDCGNRAAVVYRRSSE